MKKILSWFFLLLVIFVSFSFSDTIFANCSIEWDDFSISWFLNDCKPSRVVWWWDNYTIDRKSWFWSLIQRWITNISFLLWVLAVGSMVYSALLMQLSWGEDEKITKAKSIFKWTVIWFLLLISVNAILYLVVTLSYELAS